MKATCPRLVIAGTGSGVGKTSLALGLARCFARQGLRVQTFKVGPDFLDPTYLAMASSRTCYNLDGWMTSREYVRRLFAEKSAGADLAIVEGVMGMFDGASPRTLEGSTAEIALWLEAPVLLVVNAHGAARSLAAMVRGFAQFEPGVQVAGVVANQGGSQRHRASLGESLAAASNAPLLGMIPRGSLPTLPSRHLGLVTADQAGLTTAILDQLADVCAQTLDLPLLLDLARSTPSLEAVLPSPFGREPAPCLPSPGAGGEGCAAPGEAIGNPHNRFPHLNLLPEGEGDENNHRRPVRLGIARDEAFHFYYADNLESLSRAGVEWIPFSSLHDKRLPSHLDGLYFGGGYPELCAERLSANGAMLSDIRKFAASGGSIYAECGGMMYLGRALRTIAGARHPLVGILPIETAMLPKLKSLGYVEIAWAGDSLWGAAGQIARGHEFHYSEIIAGQSSLDGWQPAYTVRRGSNGHACEGYCKGNVLAGYLHLHWASRPTAIRHFLSHCGMHS